MHVYLTTSLIPGSAKLILSEFPQLQLFPFYPTNQLFPAVRSSNGSAKLEISDSTTAVRPFDSADWEVEYFVASDAAAIIEHTKQVLFLEDDDVAFVEDGALTIHRISRHADNGEQKREVQLLEMELQEIMKVGSRPNVV